jgi:glutamine cyclotransferase
MYFLKNYIPGRIMIVMFCILAMCASKQDVVTEQNVLSKVIHSKPEILAILPHDSMAFTQGLVMYDGRLYESTGLYNRSSIRIVDTTGIIIESKPVEGVFAEGCTFFKDILYQITWQDSRCFLYTADLQPKGVHTYYGEGWGLTSDSIWLIMSDGSDTLYFRNEQFSITKKVAVKADGKPLIYLNELEYAKKSVFANVWYSDFIFQISPTTGVVEKIIDCSELVQIEKPLSENNVLNGIAYDKKSGLFYLTGKNWKKMFVVRM